MKNFHGLDWILVMTHEEGEILEKSIILKKNIGIVSIAAVLIAMLAVHFIAADFTRPILALRDAANKVAQGELTESVAVKANDEIGKLAASFNQMTNSTVNLIHSLK